MLFPFNYEFRDIPNSNLHEEGQQSLQKQQRGLERG
jgi:hypothetical protein